MCWPGRKMPSPGGSRPGSAPIDYGFLLVRDFARAGVDDVADAWRITTRLESGSLTATRLPACAATPIGMLRVGAVMTPTGLPAGVNSSTWCCCGSGANTFPVASSIDRYGSSYEPVSQSLTVHERM